MNTVNILDANTNISGIVERASKSTPASNQVRLGFMAGTTPIPGNFDTIGADEIQQLFEESPEIVR